MRLFGKVALNELILLSHAFSLCLSLIGWICLFIRLAQSRRFRARVTVETCQAEGIIQKGAVPRP